MNVFKNKSIISYVGLILPVLAIILAIVGSATKGLVGDTFAPVIVWFLIIGALLSVAGFVFEKYDFLDIIAIIFYGLALGFIFLYGVEVIAYGTIGIDNNVGGVMELTVTYLAISALILVISIAKSFFESKNK